MATIGIGFIKELAAPAVAAAVEQMTVTVTFSGSDRWDTGSGSTVRTFSITLSSNSSN